MNKTAISLALAGMAALPAIGQAREINQSTTLKDYRGNEAYLVHRDELAALVNRTIVDTARFLKEQGKVEAVLPDYAPYVSAKFIAT